MAVRLVNSFLKRFSFAILAGATALSLTLLSNQAVAQSQSKIRLADFDKIGKGPVIRVAHESTTPVTYSLVDAQDESSPSDSTQSNQAQAKQDDVPNPPQTGDANRQIGPPLAVRSNAATMPDECYRRGWCNLGPEIKLFGPTCSGTQLGGWAQYGYHNRDTRAFNRHSGDDSFHQLWFYAENRAKPHCDWNIGYRVDGVYGLDAQRTQAFGNNPVGNPQDWDNSWDNGRYGFALPQAYAEIARGNLSIKGGKFFSILGYESIPSKENFFYSRSYSMYFIEPFTHTGALAEYQSGCTTYFAGATLGWDTGFDQVGNAVSYISGIRTRINESTDFTYASSYGDTGFRGTGYMHSIVLDVQLTDNVNTVFQTDWSDLGVNQDLSAVHYLFYHANECLAFGTRMEWYRTDRFNGLTRSTWSATFGANVRPHANIVFRPELRIDGGQAALSTGDPIFGVDAVITF